MEKTDSKPEIPKEVIILTFSGVGAMSPRLYESAVKSLATQYGVAEEDAFEQVRVVLKTLPSPFD